MERKIHQSTINNKGAKINIGGMGIRGKKEKKEKLKRCLEEREVILRGQREKES